MSRLPANLPAAPAVASRTAILAGAIPQRPVTAPITVTAPSADRDAAVARIAAALAPASPGLVLVFGSPTDAVAPIATGLTGALGPGCHVVGCSSAGEVDGGGYRNDSVVAVAFPDASFTAAVTVLGTVSRLPVSDWLTEVRRLRDQTFRTPGRTCFALLLSDGLGGHEEVLVATLDAALPDIPVIGGSAGDGLAFGRTALVLDGILRPDAAILCLIETDLSLREVVFAHFQPTTTRMVVTDARPEDRLMTGLNGAPAALEYARLVGVAADALTPLVFAEHPLLVRMGGRYFVRAISEATVDGGLKLMSAIEPGAILTLGRAGDLTEGLDAMLAGLPEPPALVLTFDCILRRLAVEHAGRGPRIAALAGRYRLAGFNTYGEQHGGMHVNQTLVGLAFLSRTPDPGVHEGGYA